MNIKKKVLLIIMDGLGAAPKGKGNAVVLAKPKNLSVFWNTFPHTYLLASSKAVGLPKNTKGNSEVGHLNLGSGRVINQSLPKINKSIRTGLYMQNDTLWDCLRHAIKHKSRIHLMGCLSDGSVHSHIEHFKATVGFFMKNNFPNELFIHAFTDGRDSSPKSSKTYLEDMQNTLDEAGIGRIGSVCGRALAMDRNQNWERTQVAYDLLVNGKGKISDNWMDAVNSSYFNGKTDEFLEPSIIKHENSDPTIKDGDVVLYMNYRADRTLQLTDAFLAPGFNIFPVKVFQGLFFAGMTPYRKGLPEHVIFPKEYINLTLGNVLSSYGLRQLRIAESEKFPHVTYFFNGGLSIKYKGEDRIRIPSPDVPTYDLQPEMSSAKVMEVLTDRIYNEMYDFIVLNIANPDMVAHTGNVEATVKAIQVVDHMVKDLVRKFTARGGSVVITADHGNAEEVLDIHTGDIDTEHSINPVPFIIAGKDIPSRMLPYGALKDVAPTILDIMGIPKPSEMTGRSLLT